MSPTFGALCTENGALPCRGSGQLFTPEAAPAAGLPALCAVHHPLSHPWAPAAIPPQLQSGAQGGQSALAASLAALAADSPQSSAGSGAEQRSRHWGRSRGETSGSQH